MEDFDRLISPSEMKFETTAFWVRMFKLPLACMGKEMEQKLGATIGEVEDVDTNEDGIGWCEFLRVKVQVNVLKPLPHGRMLKMKNRSLWIAFQYEKIPKFYFQCGVICHGARGYLEGDERRKLGFDKENQYGLWLCVSYAKSWPEKKWGGGGGRKENRECDSSMDAGSASNRSTTTFRPEKKEHPLREDSGRQSGVFPFMLSKTVNMKRVSFLVGAWIQ